MTEKYRLLRIMASVYKVLAWVALIVGVVASIFILVAGSLISQQLGTAGAAGGGLLGFVAMLVYTLFTFGSLYALSEGIYLLFDIESEVAGGRAETREKRRAA